MSGITLTAIVLETCPGRNTKVLSLGSVKSAAVVRGELTGEDVAPEMLKSYWTTIVKIDPQFGSVNGFPYERWPYERWIVKL